MSWPAANLDPIARTHVLAAAIPGSAVCERVLDAPFDSVWEVATDFESGLPEVEALVNSARVVSREGERIEMLTRTFPVGPWFHNDVVLRPGWCLMATRFSTVVMAAEPAGERTRFAHLEGSPIPGARLLRPYLRWKMPGELDRIEAMAQKRADAPAS